MAVQTKVATFTGAEPLDGDFPYVDITWDAAYASSGSYIILIGVSAAEAVTCWIKDGSKTTTGCRVFAVDQFTGSASLVAVPIA